MSSKEHALELLETGKRKKGLEELRETLGVCRLRDDCTRFELLDVLLSLAYELRMDRKNGMPYFGKEKAEADRLLAEAKAILEASDERPDGELWLRWHGVARRHALMDSQPFEAVEYSHQLIRRIEALPDGDQAVLDSLRELHHRDATHQTGYHR